MVFKLLKKILGVKGKEDLQKDIFIKPKYAYNDLQKKK
tara:strand:+ start:123 stop:236 length:114 start_codon:yes stop_codon:yes gene_type:complete